MWVVSAHHIQVVWRIVMIVRWSLDGLWCTHKSIAINDDRTESVHWRLTVINVHLKHSLVFPLKFCHLQVESTGWNLFVIRLTMTAILFCVLLCLFVQTYYLGWHAIFSALKVTVSASGFLPRCSAAAHQHASTLQA